MCAPRLPRATDEEQTVGWAEGKGAGRRCLLRREAGGQAVEFWKYLRDQDMGVGGRNDMGVGERETSRRTLRFSAEEGVAIYRHREDWVWGDQRLMGGPQSLICLWRG